MFEKLRQIEEQYHEIGRRLADPSVIGMPSEYARQAKAYSELSPIVQRFGELKQALGRSGEARRILADEPDQELRDLAQGDLAELLQRQEALERELKRLLLPRDPSDDKSVFLEIRAGAGGDEAGLFAADLARMYTKYAERQKWRVEGGGSPPPPPGGFHDII